MIKVNNSHITVEGSGIDILAEALLAATTIVNTMIESGMPEKDALEMFINVLKKSVKENAKQPTL